MAMAALTDAEARAGERARKGHDAEPGAAPGWGRRRRCDRPTKAAIVVAAASTGRPMVLLFQAAIQSIPGLFASRNRSSAQA